jgi:hypothetical protein
MVLGLGIDHLFQDCQLEVRALDSDLVVVVVLEPGLRLHYGPVVGGR